MRPTIAPEKILRELNDLWAQLDAERGAQGGVLRACSMTLVAVAESAGDVAQVRETLGEIMHDHPCRAVIVNPDVSPDEEIAAQVFAQCRAPAEGHQQQICSEGIEIAAAPAQFEELAKAMIPLRVSDLPLMVWCRGSRPFSLRVFEHLFAIADKSIFDSSAAPSARAAQDFLRGLRRRGYRVADLHWTRLTGWREIIYHLFDRQLRASQVTTARVRYGGAEPSSCALYLASWIGQALPSARVILEAAEGEYGVAGVVFSTPEGEVSIQRGEPGAVIISGKDGRYRVWLPPTDEASLMREELKILGADPVFERVLG